MIATFGLLFILHVVGMCSSSQVGRVDASPVMAGMQDVRFICGASTAMEKEREAVGRDNEVPFFVVKKAISGLANCARPIPATIRFVDLGPKPFGSFLVEFDDRINKGENCISFLHTCFMLEVREGRPLSRAAFAHPDYSKPLTMQA